MRIETRMTLALLCMSGAAVVFAASEDAALRKAHLMLDNMTLEEKAQLCAGSGTMTLPAIPRAGIPNEWQMTDGCDGISPTVERWRRKCDGATTNEFSTVLPSLQALASTWSTELASLHGGVLGKEARARGKDMILAPSVNIIRTPLFGRSRDCFSEDPVLSARMATAEIKAIQKCQVAACARNFVLNNQEDGANENDAVVNDRAFNEIYLPAFRAAVKDAGVYAIMTSRNSYNGIRCTENTYLLKGILRERWGFEGMVLSGFGAQRSCVPAAMAGVGVECNTGEDIKHFANPKDGTTPLADAVRSGEVPERVVNEKVIRTLFTMARTGFLDPNASREEGEVLTEKHQKAALRIAEEAVMLLKNDSQTLPLSPKAMNKILLVGRLADAPTCSVEACPGAKAEYEMTPYKALVEYFKVRGQNVSIEKVPLVASDGADFVHPVEGVKRWDAEWFDNSSEVQEVATKKEIAEEPRLGQSDEDGEDEEPDVMNKRTFCVRWSGKVVAPETGDYVFACDMDEDATAYISFDSREIARSEKTSQAVGQAHMEEGSEHNIAVTYISGASEGHKLSFGWQLPSELGTADELRSKAENSDAVLIFTGTEPGNGRAKEGEGADRPDLSLPDGHDDAIAQFLSWDGMKGKVIVVNRSAAPVEMPWVTNCAALVHLPYLGQEAGRALARVIFGDVNPSGKLPVTWPKSLENTAVATKGTMTREHSIYNEGLYVGYRWHDKEKIAPLFPFGHGLSYTKFEYDMDRAEVIKFPDGAGWSVSVPVKNIGSVAGREVVQIYAAYPDAKEERPVKELKGFAKTRLLSPGESETLTVSLSPRDLAYWDSFTSRFRLPTGTYEMLVGASASDIRGRAKVNVTKEASFAD